MKILRLIAIALLGSLAACGERGDSHDSHTDHETGSETAEMDRGPHGGRMLRDGDFSLEVTIFEANTPPEFRLYAFRNDKPLPAQDVVAEIRLERLGGQVDTHAFRAADDFLRGDREVTEPHSFDLQVKAIVAGRTHEWKYAAYEGRTTIPAATAKDAGIRTDVAGPATIHEYVQLAGTVELNANRHAHLKARFPGTVRAVRVEIGQRVRRGQPLVVIEANESMREYTLAAPFDGIVLARETNVGDVTGEHPLVEIADLSEVWVELHALGDSAARITAGQPMRISSATTTLQADTRVDTVLPLATRGQSIVVRARLPNPRGEWRPGMTISADVTVARREAAIAVRESGLQRFRDFTVVFAQAGDDYEVRMLELGARDGDFAQVLRGLDAGTRYVTEQSFLVKADIEKSGAGHDH